MRAIAGPAMALLIALAFAGYRMSHKPDSPPREFTDLELSLPGEDGKAVELVKVAASQGNPQDPTSSLDELLSAPDTLHSTPVNRCRDPGATGYRFKRK